MIRMEREQYERLRTESATQISHLQRELRKLKARLTRPQSQLCSYTAFTRRARRTRTAAFPMRPCGCDHLCDSSSAPAYATARTRVRVGSGYSKDHAMQDGEESASSSASIAQGTPSPE